MKPLTVKSFFELNNNGSSYIVPAGSKLNFIKETYHFYHAYYESHNYKALVKELEMSVHRIHDAKVFKLLSCKPTHGNKNKVYWQELFEEECPLEIR